MYTKTFTVSVLAGLLLCITSLFGREITGTVYDAHFGGGLVGVSIIEKGTTNGTSSDYDGKYSISVRNNSSVLVFSFIGSKTIEIKVDTLSVVDVTMYNDVETVQEVVKMGYLISKKEDVTAAITSRSYAVAPRYKQSYSEPTQESYKPIKGNTFKQVTNDPLSTFSVDVDNASYSIVRSKLNAGQLPPKDAVRIEEMINYFTYDYPQPKGEKPFSVNTELSVCPWNTDNYLLHIGLQGESKDINDLPASNLVFLLDVSGSMNYENKLPLLKRSLSLLVNMLRPDDRVAIVVYAGSSGLVLPSTSGAHKQTILESLGRLNAGGSTAGGAGLKLAYKVAQEHFIPNGNNRIIMATDGDFNVGLSSNDEMEKLITEKRDLGIAISVLGFGNGNLKDDKMEIIADKGNGNYLYIDNLLEANKALVSEFGSTLYTIAKDVKLQIEFNPLAVAQYRLVGYENRLLENEDFADDKKDAGDIGAGHSVTALYEIVPAQPGQVKSGLKYQSFNLSDIAKNSNDLVTVKLRYKEPQGKISKLLEVTVQNDPSRLSAASDNFIFSAAVAEYGMLLRNSPHKGAASFQSAIDLAKSAKGRDNEGYRAEFIRLVQKADLLEKTLQPVN